jgi:hypothetical protein
MGQSGPRQEARESVAPPGRQAVEQGQRHPGAFEREAAVFARELLESPPESRRIRLPERLVVTAKEVRADPLELRDRSGVREREATPPEVDLSGIDPQESKTNRGGELTQVIKP